MFMLIIISCSFEDSLLFAVLISSILFVNLIILNQSSKKTEMVLVQTTLTDLDLVLLFRGTEHCSSFA